VWCRWVYHSHDSEASCLFCLDVPTRGLSTPGTHKTNLAAPWYVTGVMETRPICPEEKKKKCKEESPGGGGRDMRYTEKKRQRMWTDTLWLLDTHDDLTRNKLCCRIQEVWFRKGKFRSISNLKSFCFFPCVLIVSHCWTWYMMRCTVVLSVGNVVGFNIL
jgi:hypothetical protein